MAAEFIVTSTPMSLVKILTVCGVDTEQQAFKVDPHNIEHRQYSILYLLQDFKTVCIVLEVFFAASDFYLFCWCHDSLRQKVALLNHLNK